MSENTVVTDGAFQSSVPEIFVGRLILCNGPRAVVVPDGQRNMDPDEDEKEVALFHTGGLGNYNMGMGFGFTRTSPKTQK